MTVKHHAMGLPASLLSPGVIVPYAGPTTLIPAGWLLCDGSPVSRTTYRALFAKIQTTWGAGDGVNTFNLPSFIDNYAYGTNVLSGNTNSNNNTHNHASQPMNVSVGTISGGAVSHSHSLNVSAAGASNIGLHNHGESISFNTGNSTSNANKGTGTTGVQPSGHSHGVSGSLNAATDSHNHGVNNPASTNAASTFDHEHWTNTTINSNFTQGNVAPQSFANHESSNFQTLFLIKT